MNKRDIVRYACEYLPDNIRKVTITWDGNSPIESNVLDYCAYGIRVSIPSSQIPFEVPIKDDIIKVLMPIGQMYFTGMCISTTNEQDGSISMGIYFNNPTEQNYLQNLLYKYLNKHNQPCSFVSHEWEELVDKLCNSDDPHLRKIGHCEKLTMYDGKKVMNA